MLLNVKNILVVKLWFVGYPSTPIFVIQLIGCYHHHCQAMLSSHECGHSVLLLKITDILQVIGSEWHLHCIKSFVHPNTFYCCTYC